MKPVIPALIRTIFPALLIWAAAIPNWAQPQPSPAVAQSRIRVPAGWAVHQGPSGLVAFHPAAWKVLDRSEGGFLSFLPGPGAVATSLVLVQPIRSIEGRALGVVQSLGQVFPDLFPGARVSRSQVISSSPEVAIAAFEYAPAGFTFRGSALCFRRGSHGVIYVMASRPDSWIRDSVVMEQMLDLFFYSMRDVPGAPPLPGMTEWRDPKEGAFTCPVPTGWSVEGGLQRLTAVDYRPEVLATSPDGRALIRLGDASIPKMAHPGQMMLNMGFTEGRWYSPDGMTQQLVLRYLPGAEFMTQFYLPRRVGRFSNVAVKNLPELSQHEMTRGAQAGIPMRADTAELSFDAETDSGPRRGYGFVQTLFFPLPGGDGQGWWMVNRLFGYLAEPRLEKTAETLLNQMAAGFKMDPAWETMQLRTTAKVSKIWSDTHREIGDMIRDTFQRRSDSMDRSHERWNRAFRGQVLIEEPNTRQRFEVPSGSNYYWRVAGGNDFIGTETSDPVQLPNHWVQQMRRID